MKNKKIKYRIFIKIVFATALSVALAISAAGSASAWSTYTHAAASAEAFSDFPSLLPQAVFSSSLPDITTNFISPASKDSFYKVFHGEEFRRAAVRLLSKLDRNRDKTMICNIYGYLSHAAADVTAHDPSGYANAKKTFAVRSELDHYVAYLFMDMFCYHDYFYGYGARFGKFVPDVDAKLVEAALAEYNSRGVDKVAFDRSGFAAKEAAFKAGTAVQKAIFDMVIEQNPELFEQARSFYSDYYLGVGGTGGFHDAVAAVEENVASGAGFRLSENALKTFVDKQVNEITYIGMQIASALAKDTEFIRTSSLTSGKIEGLVSKFFESKSESTKSMGKFLSALLLKKGLTYEDVIAYTDGVAVPPSNESEKCKKYRAAFKKLKEPRWYSFIPGSDSKEKREYADAFIEYRRERLESEIAVAGLSPELAAAVRGAEEKRLSAYRESYLASRLDPVKYVMKKAASDAAFANAGIVKSLAAAKKAAGGNAVLSAAAARKARAIAARNEKYRSAAAGRKFFDRLLNPFRTLYEKEYSAVAASNGATLEKLASVLSASPGASGVTASRAPETPSCGADSFDPASFSAGQTSEAFSSAGARAAYSLMQKAYKDYVEFLRANGSETERDAAGLDRRLQKYLYYKNAFERLRTGSKSE